MTIFNYAILDMATFNNPSISEAHHTTNKMEFPPHIFCLPYCLLSAAVLKKNTATTTERRNMFPIYLLRGLEEFPHFLLWLQFL